MSSLWVQFQTPGPTGSCNSLHGAFPKPHKKLTSWFAVLNIKCFYTIAGVGVLGSAVYYSLKQFKDDPKLLSVVEKVVLPVGNKLLEMSQGSICLTVQAESLSALKALWRKYKDGSLQKALSAWLVTDKIKEMAKGQEVELEVTIDEDSYRYALLDLYVLESQGWLQSRHFK